MSNTRPRIYGSIVILLLVAGLAAGVTWLVGVFSEAEIWTTSPSDEQIAHAREYLYVAPGLEIEPLAYYEKRGMDHIVACKFIAKTDDPALVFDPTQVDASEYSNDFVFPQYEPSHYAEWWDLPSRTIRGGEAWVPRTGENQRFWLMNIGIADNGDGTLTVYVSRIESGQYRS